MTISFDVPSDIEATLRSQGHDPSITIKEAALVELYRRRAISRRQLTEGLGLERLEVDAVLKRHDMPLDLTVDELRAEVESLRRARGG